MTSGSEPSKSSKPLKALTPEQAKRYSRHILLPSMDWTGQERLLASHVVVQGVGGLGCSVAQFLALSGVGKLTLIDDDVVELSNLQRQVLHSESRLGMNKAESAKRQLQALNSSIAIEVLPYRPAQSELMTLAQHADVLVDGTDNLDSRNALNEVSVATQTPLIAGAAIRMEGQISCFFPNLIAEQRQPASEGDAVNKREPEATTECVPQPCYACLSQLFGEQSQSCMASGVLSPVVGIIGAMQALETVKYLSGAGVVPQGKLMLFDAATSEWRTMQIPVNPHCRVCQAKRS